MRSRVILIITLSILPLLSFGQKDQKFFLKLGYGYYQGINANVNYLYSENKNIGVGLGSHFGFPPLEGEQHINLVLEHNIHFGQQKKFNVKPWIFSQQAMYWRTESNTGIWHTLSVSPTIGFIIALTKNLGINFEVGPTFNLVIHLERKWPYESGWIWPVLYNYRIQLIWLI